MLLPYDRCDETLSFAPHGVELERVERAEENADPSPVVHLMHLYLVLVVLAHFTQPQLEDLVAGGRAELDHLFVEVLLLLCLIVLGDPGRQISLQVPIAHHLLRQLLLVSSPFLLEPQLCPLREAVLTDVV